MAEFDIKDDRLIMFSSQGDPQTYLLESEDGKQLISFLAQEFETTPEAVIKVLREDGPIEP